MSARCGDYSRRCSATSAPGCASATERRRRAASRLGRHRPSPSTPPSSRPPPRNSPRRTRRSAIPPTNRPSSTTTAAWPTSAPPRHRLQPHRQGSHGRPSAATASSSATCWNSPGTPASSATATPASTPLPAQRSPRRWAKSCARPTSTSSPAPTATASAASAARRDPMPPTESLRLHDKLYIYEEDTRTYLAPPDAATGASRPGRKRSRPQAQHRRGRSRAAWASGGCGSPSHIDPDVEPAFGPLLKQFQDLGTLALNLDRTPSVRNRRAARRRKLLLRAPAQRPGRAPDLPAAPVGPAAPRRARRLPTCSRTSSKAACRRTNSTSSSTPSGWTTTAAPRSTAS